MSDYARRVDGNHGEIRDAVRAAGYEWIDLFRVGHGVPDALVVAKSGVMVFFEIKQPGERLNAREQQWWADYPRALKMIVTSAEGALDCLEGIDAWAIMT